jgi:hypothetical protein
MYGGNTADWYLDFPWDLKFWDLLGIWCLGFGIYLRYTRGSTGLPFLRTDVKKSTPLFGYCSDIS